MIPVTSAKRRGEILEEKREGRSEISLSLQSDNKEVRDGNGNATNGIEDRL